MTQPMHILSVDVEDWPRSTLDHSLPTGDRVLSNTRALIEIFAESGTRATFFIMGKVAEKHTDLTREIARAGHEVAAYGYSHESLKMMSAKQFREELHRSVEILREQTGEPVYGHRAADFSISPKRLYYLEYLAQEGLSYDSSILPIFNARYGIPGAYPYPHLIRCASRQMLIEFPPATMKLGGIRVAGVGGGYFRFLPYWWSKLTLRRFEREQRLATCYLDSCEIDRRAIPATLDSPLAALPVRSSLKYKSTPPKLRRLLSDFQFTTMGEVCKSLTPKQFPLVLDLAILPIHYGNIWIAPGGVDRVGI